MASEQTVSLAAALASGPMPLGQALAMLDALCEVVGEQHRTGQAHGGLTPAVVTLEGPRVRIAAAGATADRSFRSPQQLEGKAADPRADVFALGVIGYIALTGADPFGGPQAEDAARLAAIEQGPADPRTALPKLTERVAKTLLIALQRNLTERFADALTMRAALRGDSQVALDTPTLEWAVKEGAPAGEVTEGMAEFLSDAPPASADVPAAVGEPPVDAVE